MLNDPRRGMPGNVHSTWLYRGVETTRSQHSAGLSDKTNPLTPNRTPLAGMANAIATNALQIEDRPRAASSKHTKPWPPVVRGSSEANRKLEVFAHAQVSSLILLT